MTQNNPKKQILKHRYTVTHNTYNHRKAKANQQTTVRSVHMCVHCTVHNCCTQCCSSRPDNFPCTLLTITIAPMTSVWGKGQIRVLLTTQKSPKLCAITSTNRTRISRQPIPYAAFWAKQKRSCLYAEYTYRSCTPGQLSRLSSCRRNERENIKCGSAEAGVARPGWAAF